MAHELIQADGSVAFVSVREKPWHGLGKIVQNAMTSKEAIVEGGLNWNVYQSDVFGQHDGMFPVPTHKINYRNMMIDGCSQAVALGIVKKDYQVIQNTECFDFFDNVIGSKEAIFETAGAVKNGQRVFLTAKLRNDMVVGSKDVIEKYLMLATSHDGTLSLRMFWTPIRVVCNNTLSAALSKSERSKAAEETGIKIRHSGKVEDKVEEAVKILGIANKKYEMLEKLYNDLYAYSMSPDSVADYFKAVLPDDEEKRNTQRVNARQKMMNLYMNGAGADMARGTAWGAYNAVTEFVDHAKRSDDLESNFNRVLFGAGYTMKNRALELVAEAVGSAGSI